MSSNLPMSAFFVSRYFFSFQLRLETVFCKSFRSPESSFTLYISFIALLWATVSVLAKSEKNRLDFFSKGLWPANVSQGEKLSKNDCTKLLGLLSVSDWVNNAKPIPSLKNVLLQSVRLLPVSVITLSQTFILSGNW